MDILSGYEIDDSLIRAFEVQNELDHAIKRLSNEDKELLYLNDIAGFTLREIAELRGVSLDLIQSRHARAMKQIKKK